MLPKTLLAEKKNFDLYRMQFGKAISKFYFTLRRSYGYKNDHCLDVWASCGLVCHCSDTRSLHFVCSDPSHCDARPCPKRCHVCHALRTSQDLYALLQYQEDQDQGPERFIAYQNTGCKVICRSCIITSGQLKVVNEELLKTLLTTHQFYHFKLPPKNPTV